MKFDPKPSVKAVSVHKFAEGRLEACDDLIVLEEPLEIRLGFGPPHARAQKSISVTMRTPGHDFELAMGFLFTEGIIQSPNDITRMHHCQQVASMEAEGNIVKAELRPGLTWDADKLQRNFYAASSCGVCGKSSLEAIEAQGCTFLPVNPKSVKATTILSLASSASSAQIVFRHTGGIHAAATFDRQGNLMVSREDVGRHNAVDKVLGAVMNAQGQQPEILLLSGRAGFELVQKAAMGKIPVVASVGAPSSLAVEVAQRFGITLIGFLRDGRFNMYTYPDRVDTDC